jgi:Fur family transcriptional regulator, ferric uptake regulator
MTNNRVKLERTLRESGQSITIPRLAVFDYLSGRGPIDIYSVVTQCMKKVDRASIYRTLALYRQLGIVNDLVVGGQKVIELSDEFSGHHHHLSCTSCGKSVDITDSGIERRLESVAVANGFLATAHQIEVSGLCSNCR